MNPSSLGKLIGAAIIILVIVIAAAQSTYVVEPGFRGVEVVLGKVSEKFKPEGFAPSSPSFLPSSPSPSASSPANSPPSATPPTFSR